MSFGAGSAAPNGGFNAAQSWINNSWGYSYMVNDDTQSNDPFRGTSRRDFRSGHHGRERMYGGPSNDFMFGNSDRDIIFGGTGYDYVDGGRGNDWFDGGQGHDLMLGDRGNDILAGGSGNDVYTMDSTGKVIDIIDPDGGTLKLFGNAADWTVTKDTNNRYRDANTGKNMNIFSTPWRVS